MMGKNQRQVQETGVSNASWRIEFRYLMQFVLQYADSMLEMWAKHGGKPGEQNVKRFQGKIHDDRDVYNTDNNRSVPE